MTKQNKQSNKIFEEILVEVIRETDKEIQNINEELLELQRSNPAQIKKTE